MSGSRQNFAALARLRSLAAAGRYDDLETAARRAISENAGPVAIGYLAQALLHSNRPIEAAQAAHAFASADPTSDWALRLLAVAQSKVGRHKAANETARRAIAMRPDAVAPRLTAVSCSLAAKDVASARALADSCLEMAPDDTEVWATKGQVHDAANEPDEAEAAYRKALSVDPENAVALNNLGRIVLKRRRSWEAMDLFDRAAKADPRLEAPRKNLLRTAKFAGGDGLAWAWSLLASLVFVSAISEWEQGNLRVAAILACLVMALAIASRSSDASNIEDLPPAARELLKDQSWHAWLTPAIARRRLLAFFRRRSVLILLAILVIEVAVAAVTTSDAGGAVVAGLLIVALCVKFSPLGRTYWQRARAKLGNRRPFAPPR